MHKDYYRYQTTHLWDKTRYRYSDSSVDRIKSQNPSQNSLGKPHDVWQCVSLRRHWVLDPTEVFHSEHQRVCSWSHRARCSSTDWETRPSNWHDQSSFSEEVSFEARVLLRTGRSCRSSSPLLAGAGAFSNSPRWFCPDCMADIEMNAWNRILFMTTERERERESMSMSVVSMRIMTTRLTTSSKPKFPNSH